MTVLDNLLSGAHVHMHSSLLMAHQHVGKIFRRRCVDGSRALAGSAIYANSAHGRRSQADLAGGLTPSTMPAISGPSSVMVTQVR